MFFTLRLSLHSYIHDSLSSLFFIIVDMPLPLNEYRLLISDEMAQKNGEILFFELLRLIFDN